MKWILRIILAVALVWLAWFAWQRVFVTDETLIKRRIAAMEQAVERGRLLGLADFIDRDYHDDFGLDKLTLIGAVRAYRQQYKGLFIHITELRIEVEPAGDSAQVVLVAKVLAEPKAGGQQTEVMADRFRLSFRKTNDVWKLLSAGSPELKFD